jgi:hypothetical protein
MKSNRFLAIFLVVAAWLTSLCLFMEPSHACCEQGKRAIEKVLPPCCVGDSATQAQPDQTGHSGPTPDLWLGGTSFDYQALLNYQQPALEQARKDLAYIPDQSGRYLELRVLLN